MCGIFGAATTGSSIDDKKLRSWSDTLFKLSDSRGKEASGIAIRTQNDFLIYKRPLRGTKLIRTPEYKELFTSLGKDLRGISFIGHARLATNGSKSDANNNQPVVVSSGVVIHNGIVVNDKEIWKNVLGKKPKSEVDTEAIAALIEKYRKKGSSFENAFSQTYSIIKGAASIAYFSTTNPVLVLATNTGSLYYAFSKDKFVFASEEYIVRTFIDKEDLKMRVSHLKVGTGIVVNLSKFATKLFSLKSKLKSSKEFSLSNSNSLQVRRVEVKRALPEENSKPFDNTILKLKRHGFDYKKIQNLKRCTKCILPETMPFIVFDKSGVCNYCLNHQKIKYQGKAELLRVIKKYKSKDGKPDCILALSGGRDSSYGLHFVKKELGMNPIAYTYDWGMCTDIARRNQYKMTGDLGVEHVIVSGDIVKKREHIKKNILAWLKKPDLGMVPLFMEGDKQNEYYVNRLARRTGIKLIIYCRGNELENEEFKWGYCGIKNATPGGVIHNLSLVGKLKLLTYWASRYLTNWAYINSSILDTLFGFFATYMGRHDYLYLWHYIPWNEDKIVTTLKNGYDWEGSPETKATWRIDDGTPAFYNYIYYGFQGFTENDTFRSNQVREGIITRKEALALVNEENKPRYKGLKWYFDSLDLDGDMVLTSIDKQAKFVRSPSI